MSLANVSTHPTFPAMSKTVPTMTEAEIALRRTLAERMVIIDGAMGTTIRELQRHRAARGARFKDAPKDLKNNGDIYSLACQRTKSSDIHRRFLDAGSDIIETNTFSATAIGRSEFFIEDARKRRQENARVLPRKSSRTSSFRSSRTTSISTPPASAASAPTGPYAGPPAVAATSPAPSGR